MKRIEGCTEVVEHSGIDFDRLSCVKPAYVTKISSFSRCTEMGS